MAFQSKNMNYIFNVEYFQGFSLMENNDTSKYKIEKNNRLIREFVFRELPPTVEWRKLTGYHEIVLYTTYPGVLLGVGNPHELAIDGAIKCGFSFDYVTGLPYLPGSSLKGILRSCFPSMLVKMTTEEKENHISYLKAILGETDIDLDEWEQSIFENNDVFLGAYPETEGEKDTMMEMEFITSHKKRFKNPNPVSIMKVKPNVKFVFSFLLNGNQKEVEQKLRVFRALILDVGIGAKTNVGFGRLSEEKTRPADNKVPQEQKPEFKNSHEKRDKGANFSQKKEFSSEKKGTPNCANAYKGCENKVTINPITGDYFKFCRKCNMEYKSGKR